MVTIPQLSLWLLASNVWSHLFLSRLRLCGQSARLLKLHYLFWRVFPGGVAGRREDARASLLRPRRRRFGVVRGLLRVPRRRDLRSSRVPLHPVHAEEVLPRTGGNDEAYCHVDVTPGDPYLPLACD